MASNGKSNAVSICPGPIKRREFLRIGLSGFATLSLPALFQLRARAATEKPNARTAVILVWLRGGASHLETYDPKPDAPSEFRGVFSPISTCVPGMQISELLPRHAKIADKFTLLRSMAHNGGGHPAGSLQMLTGDPDPQDKDKPIFPDWMTVANFLRADRTRPLPNYVVVNPVTFCPTTPSSTSPICKAKSTSAILLTRSMTWPGRTRAKACSLTIKPS